MGQLLSKYCQLFHFHKNASFFEGFLISHSLSMNQKMKLQQILWPKQLDEITLDNDTFYSALGYLLSKFELSFQRLFILSSSKVSHFKLSFGVIVVLESSQKNKKENDVPQTYRNNNAKLFRRYKRMIHHYKSLQCPEFKQLIIIWNCDEKINDTVLKGQISELQTNVKDRNIHVVKNQYHSKDFRFQIPQNSFSHLYLYMRRNVELSCQQLIKGFSSWKNSSVGNIGPIIGHRITDLSTRTQVNQFKIQPINKATSFYNLAETDLAWIPKFYLDIYRKSSCQIIFQMRKYVRENNNCEDILLNFISGYFFPEFHPQKLDQSIFQANTSRIIKSILRKQRIQGFERELRNACVRQLSSVLGYNPMPYVYYEKNALTQTKQQTGAQSTKKNDDIEYYHRENEKTDFQKYIIFLKKDEIEKQFLQKSVANGLQQSLIDQKSLSLQRKINLALQKLEQILQSYSKQASTESQNGKSDNFLLLFSARQKILSAEQKLLKNIQTHDYLVEQIKQKTNQECEQKLMQVLQELQIQTAHYRQKLILVVILLGILLIIFSTLLILNFVSKKKKNKQKGIQSVSQTQLFQNQSEQLKK